MPRRAPPAADATADEVLTRLRTMADATNVAGMARFGISARGTLGISVTALRGIAKEIGRDHKRAGALWRSGVHEARQLAILTEELARVTPAQADRWVRDVDSWDTCDALAFDLMSRVPFAYEKVRAWAPRDEEFVRRAAFSLIAGLAVHDKTADDARFIALLPLIRDAAPDDRNFVKKAVNWALRSIGKRNLALNHAAIACARELRAVDSRAARWIAADALRELQSDVKQARLRELAARAAASRGGRAKRG